MGEHWRSIQWAANLELDIDRGTKMSKAWQVEVVRLRKLRISVCGLLCPRYYHFIQNTAKGSFWKSRHVHGSLSDGTEGKKERKKTYFPQSICQHLAKGNKQGVGLWQFVHLSTAVATFQSVPVRKRRGRSKRTEREGEEMEKKRKEEELGDEKARKWKEKAE